MWSHTPVHHPAPQHPWFGDQGPRSKGPPALIWRDHPFSREGQESLRHRAPLGLRCSESKIEPFWKQAVHTKGTAERTNCWVPFINHNPIRTSSCYEEQLWLLTGWSWSRLESAYKLKTHNRHVQTHNRHVRWLGSSSWPCKASLVQKSYPLHILRHRGWGQGERFLELA